MARRKRELEEKEDLILPTTSEANGTPAERTDEDGAESAGGFSAAESAAGEEKSGIDIERVLGTNGLVMFLAGFAFATAVRRKWTFVPGVLLTLACQYAMTGRAPLLTALKRRGAAVRSGARSQSE